MQGFFIEVSRKDAERVPADYVRRQTVKSAERFITHELKSFEDKVLSARERALARERELYEALLTQLIERLGALQATAAAVAELDSSGQPRRARLFAAMDTAGTGDAAAPAHRGGPPSGGGEIPGRRHLRAQRPGSG